LPEGPEVRRLVDQLQTFVFRRVGNIQAISGRYTKVPIVGLQGCLEDHYISSFGGIEEINCKGKFIYWKISTVGGNWYLFSTLGMTGTYKIEPDKYARIKFTFNDYDVGKYIGESYLYYCDMRNFGTMKFVNGDAELEKKLNSLGPDMLSDPCSFEDWIKIAKKRKHRSVVNFLMEQKYVSGIGNIYKSESLYLAKIDPRKKVEDLTAQELTRLYMAVKTVLTNAYELGGSTIRNYTDLYGDPGKYTERNNESYNHAQDEIYSTKGIMVYNQKIDPLGNEVMQLKLDDGRTTYFVPEIQQ